MKNLALIAVFMIIVILETADKTDGSNNPIQRGTYLTFGRTVYDKIMVNNKESLEQYFKEELDLVKIETDINSEQNKSLSIAEEKQKLKTVLDRINGVWIMSYYRTRISTSDGLLRKYLSAEQEIQSPPFTYVRDVLCPKDLTDGFYQFVRSLGLPPKPQQPTTRRR